MDRAPDPELGGRLAIDPTGLLFLSITSVLFLAAAVYCVGYLSRERRSGHVDFVDHLYFSNEPEAVFTGCMLMFLASMTLVTLSQHFGWMWVGVEATTLASTTNLLSPASPLTRSDMEIPTNLLSGNRMALLGNFLLAAAVAGGKVDDGTTQVVSDEPPVDGEEHAKTPPPSMLLQDLLHTKGIRVAWLEAAFMFFLVGYGTKMGLAPLHTWLPDAHSESPSVVSALLSGALLNCDFLGILRVHQICVAAGVAEFSQNLFLVFGVLSMAVAAAFILGQTDFKRMLAYSSVEHMGIMSIGIGLGGVGAYAQCFTPSTIRWPRRLCFSWPATSSPFTARRRFAKYMASWRDPALRGAVGGWFSSDYRRAAVRPVLQRVYRAQGGLGR